MNYLKLGFFTSIAISVVGCTALQDYTKAFTHQSSKRTVLIDYCHLNPKECQVMQYMNISVKTLPKMKCTEYKTYNTIKLECKR